MVLVDETDWTRLPGGKEDEEHRLNNKSLNAENHVTNIKDIAKYLWPGYIL